MLKRATHTTDCADHTCTVGEGWMGCWTDDLRMKTGANGEGNIQLCPADTMQAVLHEVCNTRFQPDICLMARFSMVHVWTSFLFFSFLFFSFLFFSFRFFSFLVLSVWMTSEGVWRGLTRPRLVLRCSNWRGYVKFVLAVGPLITIAAASYALAA